MRLFVSVIFTLPVLTTPSTPRTAPATLAATLTFTFGGLLRGLGPIRLFRGVCLVFFGRHRRVLVLEGGRVNLIEALVRVVFGRGMASFAPVVTAGRAVFVFAQGEHVRPTWRVVSVDRYSEVLGKLFNIPDTS